MQSHHDLEWGVPLHDDRALFELLILEGAQAGLSWSTILHRREGYRKAFANFDVRRIARFGPDDIDRLLSDTGIIRNRQKILATIENARQVIALSDDEKQSLDQYLWSFVDGRPIVHHYKELSELPAKTLESDTMSKALRKRGFGFVGPTICYAFMQSAGLVNDHTINCFRYAELVKA
jgi:DNA-3-methyladenine glycosylase I